jgi:molecular chaperone GrpE
LSTSRSTRLTANTPKRFAQSQLLSEEKVADTDTRTPTMNGEAESGEAIAGNGAVAAAPPELAAVMAERDEYLDQLQRSRAEFANYRRRTEREREQVRELANQYLLAQLLPAYDDLQRALKALPEEQRDTPLALGVQLVERKFWNVLERAGVTPIEAIGQPFDPALHEAVDAVPGSAADTVLDVYQPGYRLGQTLLRPAMVKVGARGDASRGVEDALSAPGSREGETDPSVPETKTKHRRR